VFELFHREKKMSDKSENLYNFIYSGMKNFYQWFTAVICILLSILFVDAAFYLFLTLDND